MKKLLGLALSLLLANTGFSAVIGEVKLSGNIEQEVSIVVTATSAANSLDLTNDQSNLKVADVTENSNSKSGYKVTLSSANGGFLKNTDVNATANNTIAYTVTYGTMLSGASLDTDKVGSEIDSASAVVANDNDLAISYLGVTPSQLLSGDYTDTITLTISAK